MYLHSFKFANEAYATKRWSFKQKFMNEPKQTIQNVIEYNWKHLEVSLAEYNVSRNWCYFVSKPIQKFKNFFNEISRKNYCKIP